MGKKNKNIRRKILFVDDNQDFLVTFKTILEELNYSVVTCSDAKSAEQVYALDNFDVVVADIRIPGGSSGIELMHTLKRMKKIPVILITAFAEFKDKEDAMKLGADGFLSKPFNASDLVALLDQLFQDAVSFDEVADVDEDFCGLSIEDFISGKNTIADVYIRLTNKKYVKISCQSDNISVEQIRAYKEKGVTKLYFKKEDFKKYVGFNMSLLPIVSKSQTLSMDKKIGFLKHTGELITAQLYNREIDKETFESAKTIVETSISVLADDNVTFNLLETLNSHTDYLYAHSLGVSMYATMIAREMKWKSPATLMKVGLGGLLHDVGLKEVDAFILSKARTGWKPNEVAIVETHPIRGSEILSRVPSMPSDIVQIISQHHENCVGVGYPLKLSRMRIHPLAKLVCIADSFCEYAIKNPDYPEGMSPQDAIKQMLMFSEYYDEGMFHALIRVLKLEPAQAV